MDPARTSKDEEEEDYNEEEGREEGGAKQDIVDGDHEDGGDDGQVVEEGDHEEEAEEGGDAQKDEEEVEGERGLEIQEIEDEGAVEEEVKAEGSDEIEEECGNEIAEELEEVHVLIDADHEDEILHPSSKNEMGVLMNLKLAWSKPYIIFIAFAGNLSFFAKSLVIGVFNEVLIDLAKQYDETLLLWTLHLSPIVGAAIASLLPNLLGRKKVVIVSDVFVFGGLVGMAFSKTNWTVVGSMAFIGAGLGLGSAAAPLLLSESAPKTIRGAVVCTSSLASTIGQWAPYLVLLLSKKVNFSWRWTIGLASLPAFIQLICMIFLEESPYTLAKQGKKGEVEKFLKRTFPAEEVQKEMDEIFESSIEDGKKEEEEEVLTQNSFLKKIKTLMKVKQLGYLLGAALLNLFQHFLGLNFILNKFSKLSDQAGLSKHVKSLLPKFLDLLSSLFVVVSVDLVGRRKLLLSSLMLLTLVQLILGFVLGRTENLSFAKFTMVAVSLFLVAYSTGIGCLPILLTVEIDRYSYRGMASGIGAFCSWLGTLCTSRTTTFTVDNIGPTVFFIYSGVSVIVFCLVIFLIPEKVGTPLEKLDSSVGQTTKYQRLE